MEGLRTYLTDYNVSSYVLSNGDVNTSDSYHGMDPNHCLQSLYTKDGVHTYIFIYVLNRYMLNPPSSVLADGWTFHYSNWAPYRSQSMSIK